VAASFVETRGIVNDNKFLFQTCSLNEIFVIAVWRRKERKPSGCRPPVELKGVPATSNERTTARKDNGTSDGACGDSEQTGTGNRRNHDYEKE
jgi:hypothetical protein